VVVYRAFLADVGLARVCEASTGVCSTTHATTGSLAFSTGFGDPIFLNSNRHSEKTDAFGIGVSLLVALVGEPANGLLNKWEDDGIAEFMEVGGESALDRLASRAEAVAGWPVEVTRGLACTVHGLSISRKAKRTPLPCALQMMEAILHAAGVSAPTMSTMALAMVGDCEVVRIDNTHGSGLTRLVCQLDRLAVDGGGDAALARMQKHVNTAFISMMTRLEVKYAEEGHSPLPREMQEHDRINALAPRHFCPTLTRLAHTLRLWWNAAKHERSHWLDPPSDKDVSDVVQGVMSELARLGW